MDERLERLITEVQQLAPQTQEWQYALTRLVDEIMRSRSLCRPLKSQPLFGVYQEIYEQVRQQILLDVGEQLHQYNSRQTPGRIWANMLRNQAFKQILDDAQLKKLALAAQSHPPHSELRQYGLGELIEAIRLSGRLCRPHREKFSSQFYELLYDEAVNKTLIYVCRKLDKYDPERGDGKFMNWVNFRLDRVLLESAHEFRGRNIEELPDLDKLEEIVQSEELPSPGELIRDCIEKDVENIFKRAHIRNRPDANFQVIVLAIFSDKKWQEISKEFDIPLPTLSSFFQRCCEKFWPQLIQLLKT